MNCTECEGKLTRDTNATIRYDLGDLPHITLQGVILTRCDACGLEDVTIPRIGQLHRALAQHFVSQARALAPTEIRFLRKHMGMSSIQFAKYMGTARETVSRWETGKTPMGNSADRLLRLLVVSTEPEQNYEVLDLLGDLTEKRAPKHLPRFGMRMSSTGWRMAA